MIDWLGNVDIHTNVGLPMSICVSLVGVNRPQFLLDRLIYQTIRIDCHFSLSLMRSHLSSTLQNNLGEKSRNERKNRVTAFSVDRQRPVDTATTLGQDYKRFSSMDWCSTHNLCSATRRYGDNHGDNMRS